MSTARAEEQPHDPAFRCATWTQARGVDPIGSATTFDALLLVEWPLPWPSDVGEIPLLAGREAPGVRIMTVVPEQGDDPAGRVRVVHHRRVRTNHLEGVDHVVDRTALPELLDVLLAAPHADSSHLPSCAGDAPPEVLVCAHGRRDPCCGRGGTLLHLELSALWSDVRTWRCSHTGGHRFAPTAITLPDGRAWAYVEPPLMEAVVARAGDVDAVLAHDRGSSALDAWAQAAEREAFRHVGWSWLDRDLAVVETEVAPDGASARVRLEWGDGAATADVVVVREVPVLTCGAPPDQAKKSSRELAVRRFELDAGDR